MVHVLARSMGWQRVRLGHKASHKPCRWRIHMAHNRGRPSNIATCCMVHVLTESMGWQRVQLGVTKPKPRTSLADDAYMWHTTEEGQVTSLHAAWYMYWQGRWADRGCYRGTKPCTSLADYAYILWHTIEEGQVTSLHAAWYMCWRSRLADRGCNRGTQSLPQALQMTHTYGSQ